MEQDLIAILALVFVLGIKHGFDADHLATIDGLTRFNRHHKPKLARFCGTLFSLGHGGVVVFIALGVSQFSQQWQVPEWLDALGTWISIAFLLLLGSLNLLALIQAGPNTVIQPVGFKGRWLGCLAQASSPGLIALVGALFALSFDTLSQAALFAFTATQLGGWQHALLLGLTFLLGMLLTDAVNGFWIAHLIGRADQLAVRASRVMSLVVAGISFLVAGFGAAKFFSQRLEAWSEGKELYFGFLVIVLVALSFIFSRWLNQRRHSLQLSSEPLV